MMGKAVCQEASASLLGRNREHYTHNGHDGSRIGWPPNPLVFSFVDFQ